MQTGCAKDVLVVFYKLALEIFFVKPLSFERSA